MSVGYESSYDVKKFSGLIHSPFGDFDPLVDPIPLGPENLYDSSAILIAFAVATKLNDCVSTSSLAWTPEMRSPSCNAEVPLTTATDLVTPKNFADFSAADFFCLNL